MTDLVLGIDIGTTSLKVAAFDMRGRRLRSVVAEVRTRHAPGGLAEQDPAAWMHHVRAALSDLGRAGLLPRIAAVGVTSQVNTHVFVDADGHPLAPAILWQDGRAAPQAAGLDAGITAEERLRWWEAPMTIDASHALARMAWMAATHPDVWERTRAVLLPKDLVIRALTGALVSDPMSNLGLVGSDLRYVADLLDRVPGAAARLPPLGASTDIAGETALAPGLPPVPVAIGLMDAWAGLLGVGLGRDGDAAYLSGTSEVLAKASSRVTGEPGILVFPRHAGIRLHAGPTQSGGASVAWFCAAFGTTPEAMDAEVTAAGPDLLAPLFLPHLAGERAPLWDAAARGAFLGLEAGMGRAALARGVFEGVALSARLLAEAIDASSGHRSDLLLCGGGGFRSDAWTQIRADVLGRALKRLAAPDAGVLGAAALATVAAGLQPDLAGALADLVVYDRTFEPDPAQAARFDDLFGLYRPAYEALRPVSRALARRGG